MVHQQAYHPAKKISMIWFIIDFYQPLLYLAGDDAYGEKTGTIYMKFVTMAGPPSSGKSSVLLKTIAHLEDSGLKAGVVKFDCLKSNDKALYEAHGIPVKLGLAGNLCPDHFFIINIEGALQWGKRRGFDVLISESAGLCNRCSPHIRNIRSVCVIDSLSGIHTPEKLGPMLRFADTVVITKGDIVSQAEREVFQNCISKVNPLARIIPVNGITGQGSFRLSRRLLEEGETETLLGRFLHFSMPSALCNYCIGQTKISENYSAGNLRLIDFSDEGEG
jgi:Ni2+-binding GTPase involved in maturation of urease and hydrogenase